MASDTDMNSAIYSGLRTIGDFNDCISDSSSVATRNLIVNPTETRLDSFESLMADLHLQANESQQDVGPWSEYAPITKEEYEMIIEEDEEIDEEIDVEDPFTPLWRSNHSNRRANSARGENLISEQKRDIITAVIDRWDRVSPAYDSSLNSHPSARNPYSESGAGSSRDNPRVPQPGGLNKLAFIGPGSFLQSQHMESTAPLVSRIAETNTTATDIRSDLDHARKVLKILEIVPIKTIGHEIVLLHFEGSQNLKMLVNEGSFEQRKSQAPTRLPKAITQSTHDIEWLPFGSSESQANVATHTSAADGTSPSKTNSANRSAKNNSTQPNKRRLSNSDQPPSDEDSRPGKTPRNDPSDEDPTSSPSDQPPEDEDARPGKTPRNDPPDEDPTSSPTVINPWFRCHYNARHPNRYSERNHEEKEYRTCSSCKLLSIPRVKQHLELKHERPMYYCARCFQIFVSRAEVDSHSRLSWCPLKTEDECPFREKMTETQAADIHRRRRGGTDEAKWYYIYKVLFPGSPLPESPYVGGESNDDHRAFLDHCQQRLPVFVTRHLTNMGISDFEAQAITEALVLEAALSEIETEYRITATSAEALKQSALVGSHITMASQRPYIRSSRNEQSVPLRALLPRIPHAAAREETAISTGSSSPAHTSSPKLRTRQKPPNAIFEVQSPLDAQDLDIQGPQYEKVTDLPLVDFIEDWNEFHRPDDEALVGPPPIDFSGEWGQFQGPNIEPLGNAHIVPEEAMQEVPFQDLLETPGDYAFLWFDGPAPGITEGPEVVPGDVIGCVLKHPIAAPQHGASPRLPAQ